MKPARRAHLPRNHAGLLIDTNLLAVLAVGAHNPTWVERVRRTRAYTAADFHALRDFIRPFRAFIITPHILAEVSNLLLTTHDGAPPRYLPQLLELLRGMKEVHIAKDAFLGSVHFPMLGATDAAIIELARDRDLPVITDDFPLYGYLIRMGCEAANLQHLRGHDWLR